VTDHDTIAHRLAGILGADEVVVHPLTSGTSRQTFSVAARTGSDTTELVLQQRQEGDERQALPTASEVALLRAAEAVGVPVPHVVASESGGHPYIIAERVPGEAIPRRILRDPTLGNVLADLAFRCGEVVARLQQIDPSALPELDSADVLSSLRGQADDIGLVRPVIELAFSWLSERRPPPGPKVLVHGDFRLGNLLVDHGGLSAVLDWEMAHLGDPLEDLGYLCVPSWRFGAGLPVGGFGTYQQLFDGYRSVTGDPPVDPAAFRWWQVFGTLRWGVICARQVETFLARSVRSHELAAIGRRIAETERDLLVLTGPDGARAKPAGPERPDPRPVVAFDTPTAAELLDALDGWLTATDFDGATRYQARVARHIVGILRREATLGPDLLEARSSGLARLGFAREAELAEAIRSGAVGDDLDRVRFTLRQITDGRLAVNDPAYRGEPDP
jgi:aminoglycoside phosphotransferase (APT) family kinase protein